MAADTTAARFGGPPKRAVRSVAAIVATLALALTCATSTPAEEVFTSQAAAANATDTTWIPAPPQRAALCIIDTGNDALPDTTNVIARLSTDGGSGSDLNPGKHGTLMSMIASAPYDGFGMVGAAPSINVVSVRASRDGSYFGGADLQAAMQMCINKRMTYNIKVVSMSLGGDSSIGAITANATQKADFQNLIDNARLHGLNVVVAAGNSGQGSADWPAGYAPSFAIGAADSTGARCSFASWGSGLDLWAPGCPIDVSRPDPRGDSAWASGSSEATAFVAGVLTQLRGLDPTLEVDAAEQLLTHNAVSQSVGPYVNVRAAFAADNLDSVLAEGRAAIPPAAETRPSMPAGSSSSDMSGAPSPAATTVGVPDIAQLTPRSAPSGGRSRLPRPAVRSLTFRRGVLRIIFRGKPSKTEASVQVYARKRGQHLPKLARTLRIAGDRLRTQVSGMLSQVSITYRDRSAARPASAPLNLHPSG